MSEQITSEPLDGYRLCVGIFLLNESGKVFVGNRLNAQDAWQFPQGGIDENEKPIDAAYREMKEEIGTDSAEVLAISGVWRSYDLPNEIAAKMWGGRFRGQCQKWIALRFTGKNSEIDLNVEHPEFSSWQWIDPAKAIDLVVPFKRQIYVSVVDEFRRQWA